MQKILRAFWTSIKKDGWLFFMAAIIVVGVFGTNFFLNEYFLNLKNKTYIAKSQQIQEYLKKEVDAAAEKIQEIVTVHDVGRYIKAKDIMGLISILTEERSKHDLDMLSAADENGIILTRTKPSAITKRGDYIFDTTPWGKKLALNKSVSAIEVGSIFPLIIFAGEQLQENDNLIGVVMGGMEINDEFAVSFKNKYFKSGPQIAFYSKQNGLVGTSFNNQDAQWLLKNLFNFDSDWIQRHSFEIDYLKIDGQIYAIKNLAFPGIETSPGGILIFYPVNQILLNLFAATPAVLLFLILAFAVCFCHNYLQRKKIKCHSFIVIFVYAAAILITLFFAYSYNFNKKTVELKKQPYTIYNSTLSFDPPTGFFDKEFEYRIGIKLESGGETINAVQAVIDFKPNDIKITDIYTNNSFCDPNLFIEKSIDNENGEVRIACGLPHPGFSESGGLVAEILVQPLKTGEFTLRFTPETQVLADDGLGTDVLRMVTNSAFHVADKLNLGFDESNKGAIDNEQIRLFSSSHPNSENWYNSPDIKISWRNGNNGNGNNISYRYLFDQSPDSAPDQNSTSTERRSAAISALGDGVYYFHVAKETNGQIGPPTSLKFMIDRTSPSPPIVKLSEYEITPGQIIRMEFATQDSLSGLQRSYYVRLDNKIFLPVGSPFFFTFLEPGEHSVTVRAFDKANNLSDTNVKVNVVNEGFSSFMQSIYISLFN